MEDGSQEHILLVLNSASGRVSLSLGGEFGKEICIYPSFFSQRHLEFCPIS